MLRVNVDAIESGSTIINITLIRLAIPSSWPVVVFVVVATTVSIYDSKGQLTVSFVTAEDCLDHYRYIPHVMKM